MDDLERNKRTVLAFYDLMFNTGRPREAIERYAGEAYIQHDPEVADGKLVEHRDLLRTMPDKAAPGQRDVLTHPRARPRRPPLIPTATRVCRA